MDFRLTFTISLCRDWTAICKGAIILELRMFGLAPLLRSKRTLSTWFFFVAQCSGVFPEESITFNTRSKERKQDKTKNKAKLSNVLIAVKKKKKKVSSVSGLGLWYQISSKKERKRLHEIQCIVLNWLNIVLNIQYWWEEWEWWNTYFLLIILNVFRHPRVTWFPSLSLLFPILFDFTTISLETAWNKMSANKGNKRKQLSACKQ